MMDNDGTVYAYFDNADLWTWASAADFVSNTGGSFIGNRTAGGNGTNTGLFAYTAVTYDPADTDKDGDVDTADLTTMFQNFTGAGGSGKTMMDGDTDMDGDVDTADITTGFQNFTGALAGLANNPDIVYDPTTAT